MSIAQVASCLKEIIKLQNKNKLEVPDAPDAEVPQQKSMHVLGQLMKQTIEMDRKANENKDELDKRMSANWQERDKQNETNMHSRMQEKYAPETQ